MRYEWDFERGIEVLYGYDPEHAHLGQLAAEEIAQAIRRHGHDGASLPEGLHVFTDWEAAQAWRRGG